MNDPRAGMNQVEIVTQDRLDLLNEVYQAAKSLREQSRMTMVERDSRLKAEAMLDLAILNYEDSL